MRLFVGLEIPEDVVARVSALVDTLRPLAPLKWSRMEDLHVTTKFIGDEPAERVADLERALEPVAARAAITIAVRGFGFFPDARLPKVLWAGVDGGDALASLAADTERALVPLGVAAEVRPYVAHLTLARVPARAPLDALHAALTSAASIDFGTFTARRFVLYESAGPGGSGPHYLPIAKFPLFP